MYYDSFQRRVTSYFFFGDVQVCQNYKSAEIVNTYQFEQTIKMEKKSMEKEQEILARLRQDIIDNNLHVKAIIQVSVYKQLTERKYGTSS